jgi:hypothetical protein
MTIAMPMFPPALPAASPCAPQRPGAANPRVAKLATRPAGAAPTASARVLQTDPDALLTDEAHLPAIYSMEVEGFDRPLVFSGMEDPGVGDLAVLWYRPELVPGGQDQAILARMALPFPGTVWVFEAVTDSQLTFIVPDAHVLAVHKCVGVLGRVA